MVMQRVQAARGRLPVEGCPWKAVRGRRPIHGLTDTSPMSGLSAAPPPCRLERHRASRRFDGKAGSLMTRFAVLSGVCGVLLLATVAAAEQWSFQAIGDLGGTSDFGKSSRAYAVSGDGHVVVGDSLAAVGLGVTRGVEAFRWTRSGSLLGLGTLSSDEFFSTAWGVADAGRVVVGESQTVTGKRAFRWSEADGMTNLGALPGHDRSLAYAVNGDGTVIVGASSSYASTLAVRWAEAAGMMSLGSLPGGRENSVALAVSRDGLVVVGRSQSDRGSEAFCWTAPQGMRGLGDLEGGRFASVAYGVSAKGAVIVGQSYSEQGAEAFRWTADTGMVGLGDLPEGDFSSAAFAVSDDGRTIVGQASGAAGPEAVIWTEDAPIVSIDREVRRRDLAPGWQLHEARDLSDDGTTIVGIGRNPGGETAAWIVTISRP